MTRKTSIEVWQQINQEGLLTKMQRKALQVIAWHGPVTGSELDAHSNSRYMHQRISELFAVGVIRQAGRKKCSVTNRSVMAWESTGAMPHETLKGIGNQKHKSKIKELRELNREQSKTIEVLGAEVRRKQSVIERLTREVQVLKGHQEQVIKNYHRRQFNLF